MNIKREFLYTDYKLIPLQLMRMNYGISEANPSTSLDSITDNVTGKTFTIRFPHGSSNIAMMINSADDQITEIRSTSPGKNFLDLTVRPNTRYNVYIISREYRDGFIMDTRRVEQSESVGQRYIFTYDDSPTIDLGEPGAMVMSQGRNTGDTTQWYNYDTSYAGGLVWAQPYGTGSGAGSGTPKDLIYYRCVLTNMINLFTMAGGGVDSSTIAGSLKTWKAHDDLVKYMRELDADPFLSNIQEVEDLLQYLSYNTKDNYVSETRQEINGVTINGYEAHEEVEAMLSVMVYGAANSSPFTNQTLFNNSTEALVQFWGPIQPYDSYYSTVNANVTNESALAKYTNMFPAARQIFGMAEQATRLATFNEDPGGWSRGPDDYDADGAMARRDTASRLAMSMRAKRDSINTLFTLFMELPAVDTITGQEELEATIQGWAETQKENVLDFLNAKLDEVDTSISNLGLAIYFPSELPSGTIDGEGPIANAYLDQTVVPPFMVPGASNPDAPQFLSARDMRPIEQDGMPFSDQPRQNWVWYYLRTTNIIPNDYGDWDRQRPYSLGMAGNSLFETIYPAYGISSEEWTQVRDWITSNRDLVWDIEYTTGSTGSTVSDTYPQAQEAILQNIRFVKDLINTVDENLWTTQSSTNTLVISSLIKLQESMVAEPARSTVLSYTSAMVKNSNIEVLWMPFGGVWSSLSTPITDIGNNVKAIDLNTAEFRVPGKYIILVQPRHTTVNIYSTRGDYAVVRDELNDGNTANYYYGYNAQIRTIAGDALGDQKVVVESKWLASNQYLKLSPIIDNWTTFGRDLKLELWSSEFTPVLIEIDIVEHTPLTLSYSMYAKKLFNTDTGLCTLYDYAGNVYKELSFGKYSNQATGGDIIEYRIQAEDPNKP